MGWFLAYLASGLILGIGGAFAVYWVAVWFIAGLG